MTTPEVAFTGDTMSDFIIDEANIDVLRARILVMEVKPHFVGNYNFLGNGYVGFFMLNAMLSNLDIMTG